MHTKFVLQLNRKGIGVVKRHRTWLEICGNEDWDYNADGFYGSWIHSSKVGYVFTLSKAVHIPALACVECFQNGIREKRYMLNLQST